MALFSGVFTKGLYLYIVGSLNRAVYSARAGCRGESMRLFEFSSVYEKIDEKIICNITACRYKTCINIYSSLTRDYSSILNDIVTSASDIISTEKCVYIPTRYSITRLINVTLQLTQFFDPRKAEP